MTLCSTSKRSPEEAERIPGLHVYTVNCLIRVEVRARLWGFRSDNGDIPGMAQGHPVRFASSGLRLLVEHKVIEASSVLLVALESVGHWEISSARRW